MTSDSSSTVGAVDRRKMSGTTGPTRRIAAWLQSIPTPAERPVGPLIGWRPAAVLVLGLLAATGMLLLGQIPVTGACIPAVLAAGVLLVNWPQLGFLGFMLAVGLNWTVASWPTSPTKAGAALCVGSAALGLLLRGLRPRVHWIHCWLMAFACWTLVSAQAHGNAILSQQFTVTIAGWVLVMFSAYQLFVGLRGLLQVCACYVLGVTAGCVMTIAAFGSTGRSTLVPVAGDANDFGMLASSGAVLALGLARERRGPGLRILWTLCGLTCLTVAIGSYSRGAILGLVIAALAQLILRPRDRKVMLGLVLGLTLVAACVYPLIEEQVAVAVQQKDFVASGNVSSRIDAWGIALQQFIQHPVTGIGIGALQPSYFAALSLAPGALALAFAHNTYIEVLYGTGLVGAALILVAVAWSLRAGWLAPAEPAPTGGQTGPGAQRTAGGLRIMMLPALLCIFVACLTVTEIMYPPFWMAFLLAVSAADAAHAAGEAGPSGGAAPGGAGAPERTAPLPQASSA